MALTLRGREACPACGFLYGTRPDGEVSVRSGHNNDNGMGSRILRPPQPSHLALLFRFMSVHMTALPAAGVLRI